MMTISSTMISRIVSSPPPMYMGCLRRVPGGPDARLPVQDAAGVPPGAPETARGSWTNIARGY